MKIFYLLAITVCLTLTALSGNCEALPTSVVDERVELLSIVFRLAGNSEYSANDNAEYVKAIHAHFDRFTGHPLIGYARELHDSSGISYDAVMSMAVHLQPPPALTPISPFITGVPDDKFALLLKQFYQDAHCAAFFRSQQGRYALAKARFQVLFKKLDASWYSKFYGKSSNDEFNVIIGLGNGGGNYGPHLDLPGKKRKVYAVIGSDTFDDKGSPIYEAASYLPTLIHEFNHSFVNHLTDAYEKQLSTSGQGIFKKENVKMRRMAYGEWKTMYNEALVRAAVVIYLKDHATDTITADREVKSQQASGFIWMPQLVALLKTYQEQRNTYPTLGSFMPRMVDFYQQVILNIDQYEDDYLAHCAKVVSVKPFNNGAVNVNPATSTILFNFDKPLDGIRYFVGPGKLGIEHYPKVLRFTFSNDNRTLIMQVELQPNTEYQIGFTGSRMRTNDGYSVQNFSLNFKTGIAN
jgi:hypothetical protein